MASKNRFPHFLAVLGSAGRSLHDQFLSAPKHEFITPDWDLLLVLKGGGGYRINHKKILVDEGDLILLKPGDRCLPFVLPGLRFDRFFMHFSLLFSRDPGVLRRRLARLPRININGSADLKHLCLCIMREIHEGEEGRHLANHYLSELLIRLVHLGNAGSPSRPTRIAEKHSEKLNRVMNGLETGYAQKTSLLRLASQVDLSPSHLLRLFKKAYGTSIHQFLLQKRLDRAKLLLLENKSKIREIARLTGFDSAQHFSSTFRKKTGLTPTAYVSSVFRTLPPSSEPRRAPFSE